MASAGTEHEVAVEGEASQQMEIDISEFMDVVYTYNCKFCPFTCTSSEEISNHAMANHVQGHIRIQTQSTAAYETNQESASNVSEHTASKSGPEVKTSSGCQTEEAVHVHSEEMVQGEVGDELTLSSEVQEGGVHGVDSPAVDGGGDLKELFLCGQCNLGFTSIEECKGHMLQDHNVSISATEVKTTEHPISTQEGDIAMPANMVSVGTQSNTHKKPGRKRKSEIKEQPPVNEDKDAEEMEFKMDAPVSIYNMRDTENPDKRKVKPPKALMEDYYLGRRKHKRRRQPREPYDIKCKRQGCHAKFKTEEAKAIHISCHLEPKEQGPGKLFQCTKCASYFQNWKLTAKHMWKEHAVDTDLFKCYHCDFRSETLQRLETHEQVHSDQKPYICKTCGKGFKQHAQLINHEAIHNRKETSFAFPEKWYHSKVCGICNKTFSSQKSMRKHVEAVHEKVKPFKCEFCGHMTARKAMLLLHIRTHTGEKPYKCDLCTYVTGDHNTLRRHRMRHTGQKPYKCQICPYSCIQAISLKTHLKNKHPGCEGIYSCDICQYHTVSRSNWEQHQADHRSGTITAASAGASLKKDKSAPHTMAVPAQAVHAASTAKSLQSVLSLATSSGTQVLYYDPVTQQLSAGAPGGIIQQENTIVMADETTKQLMSSSSTGIAIVSEADTVGAGSVQPGEYAVSSGQGHQEILLTVQGGGQETHTATIIPEGSIIYTQTEADGEQTLAVSEGEHHVIHQEQQLEGAGAESTGLQHILTAIQNLSEEGTVTLAHAGEETAEETALEIATEHVDESVSQEQYIIEIPVENKVDVQ